MRQISACIKAFALLVFVAVQLRRRITLRRRGVEVPAVCFRHLQPGKRRSARLYLRYVPADGRGRVRIARPRDCPPGTGVGSEVPLLYDPRTPERSETVCRAGRRAWRHLDLCGLSLLAVTLAVTSPYV
ncbi:DUF3592 domain-containing protein [Streptomyces sp. NPDC006430]|uniref:DUF3592 domain-containing protein n=1 Tax=Streptomyces sp. NPDC006430 TaxID=3154299 RepID=UPI0033BA26D7